MTASSEARVLVVEDNETLRRGVQRALRETWGAVDDAATGDEAVGRITTASHPYDVVLTDLRLPGSDGVAVLRAALERDPRTSVLLMTAYGSVETAVRAMRAGAFDFVQKPLDLEQIELRVARAVEHRQLLDEVKELRAQRVARDGREDFVAESPALRAAVELAARVAPTRSTVLVTGETGTGKEVIAGLVHRLSPRSEGPLVKVNCAALPETLLESELFGHERGAFTGADRQRIGRFEEASGGSLFLDEVGDMSPATQAKLLRVLQEQEFHRLGGGSVLRTDARVIAATNRDLSEAVRNGNFREDLYFRLDVIRIHLPPLRERPEDLVVLAHQLLERARQRLDRPARSFAPETLAWIRSHDWPGNVRELQNTLERAVLLCDGPILRVADLGVVGHGAPGRWEAEFPSSGVDLREVERQLVLGALQRAGWVQKDAASLLGVSRRKLNYMIRKMGVTHPTWRRNRGEPDDDSERTP